MKYRYGTVPNFPDFSTVWHKCTMEYIGSFRFLGGISPWSVSRIFDRFRNQQYRWDTNREACFTLHVPMCSNDEFPTMYHQDFNQVEMYMSFKTPCFCCSTTIGATKNPPEEMCLVTTDALKFPQDVWKQETVELKIPECLEKDSQDLVEFLLHNSIDQVLDKFALVYLFLTT